MVSISRTRALALALPGTVEVPHFDLVSFRVRNKIYATLSLENKRAMLKLPREEQSSVIATDRRSYSAVPGYWGAHGSTYVQLSSADPKLFAKMLEIAWRAVQV